jgi:hypothetical protein
MNYFITIATFCFIAAGVPSAEAASRSLGTSAAADSQHTIWIAYADQTKDGAFVHVASFDGGRKTWRPPLRVNRKPEPVSADGENRPKIAFGAAGEMYVSWTSPTSAQYTGDIRFSRSLDGGKTWSDPVTVHRDRQLITHRFESLLVDGKGRVWVSWVDKRDLQASQGAPNEYQGAAIYYAYSADRGDSWQGDFKLADQTCECCRIAMTTDPQGHPTVMWRHIFGKNERDHAIATLIPGAAPKVSRVTFDRWQVDACPHHGPGLTIAADGRKHAVWFNQIDGEGRVFYGELAAAHPKQVRKLPIGAMHADIATTDDVLAIAWKRFDGNSTRVETWISHDQGMTFSDGPVIQSNGESDQPRLITSDGRIFLVWRRTEGTAVRQLGTQQQPGSGVGTRTSRAASDTSASRPPSVRPFGPSTLKSIEDQHRGRSFWVVLWDLECTYCMKSLANVAAAQAIERDLRVVTITTDPLDQAAQINDRLAQIGIRSDAYAFSGASLEALRYAIDPSWAGEKPRAYRYSADGAREPISGVLAIQQLAK